MGFEGLTIFLGVQLFTGAVIWNWRSAPHLWGMDVSVEVVFQEPVSDENESSVRSIIKRALPEPPLDFLRFSKQPFAIGGMRLAYYAMTESGRRWVLRII